MALPELEPRPERREVELNIMSNVRVKKGEPCILIVPTGPMGGGHPWMDIDVDEAARLGKALTKAARQLRGRARLWPKS